MIDCLNKQFLCFLVQKLKRSYRKSIVSVHIALMVVELQTEKKIQLVLNYSERK